MRFLVHLLALGVAARGRGLGGVLMSILDRVSQYPRSGMLCLFIGLAAHLPGCGSTAPPPPQDPPDSSITVLARLYGEFAMRHQGRGPANESEFQQFLEQLPEAQKKAMGVQDLDVLFRSPRDQQPYVVIYGIRQVLPAADVNGILGKPIVIHERNGIDGVMFAANALGAAEQLPGDALKQELSSTRPSR